MEFGTILGFTMGGFLWFWGSSTDEWIVEFIGRVLTALGAFSVIIWILS